MRKHIFYHFRPFILASKIDKQIMFFQSSFLDLLFLNLFKIFLKNDRFGDPLQNPMGAKMAPKSIKWRQKIEKSKMSGTKHGFVPVFFQTLFSQNPSNPCAVGTSWLLKGHFFNVHWLIVCFRCVSLCFVLYNILIFVSKNIGKRPAVELSVFWGNRRT